MVPDEVWCLIGPTGTSLGFLCLPCAEKVARSLGIVLRWRADVLLVNRPDGSTVNDVGDAPELAGMSTRLRERRRERAFSVATRRGRVT